jgi:hypothetical protein
MKIYINKGFLHHMNKISLDSIISHLKWQKVDNIQQADVVYSPSDILNTEQFPEKKFIFGPHFSVFPTDKARQISGKYNNAIYIQPSQPSVDTWVDEFKFDNIPVKAFAFPINTNSYMPSNEEKDKVILYYKQRSPEDLKIVKEFLKEKGVEFDFINYGKYKEHEYQKKLNRAKYIFWVGCHESQGFALQTALSKNVPMIAWSVKQRKQALNAPAQYHRVTTEVSTVPYWSNECGEKFYEKDEIEETFDRFIENLENYNPRKFVEDNLSIKKCSEKLVDLINEIGK